MTGTISKILHTKGYGFIRDEDGLERFLHIRDLKDSDPFAFIHLREGDRVEFEPTTRAPKNEKNNGLGVAKVQKV